MNLRLNVAIACFIVFFSYSAMARLRLDDGDYYFFNKSTNEIVVRHLVSDGKELVCCGVLVPGGRASVSDAYMYPWTLPQFFQIEYQDSGGLTHTDKLDTAW